MGQLHNVPFAQIPEWILDADVSDRAIRLFCILNRHADSHNRAFPGRPRLAERLRCSVATTDVAIRELVDAGALIVQPRYRDDGGRSSNDYWLWPAVPDADDPPSRPVEPPPSTDREAPPRPARGTPPRPARGAIERESVRTRVSERESARDDDATFSFDEFWNTYPARDGKKIGKRQAVEQWKRLTALERAEAVVGAGYFREAIDDGRIFGIKDPWRWLRDRSFVDWQERAVSVPVRRRSGRWGNDDVQAFIDAMPIGDGSDTEAGTLLSFPTRKELP